MSNYIPTPFIFIGFNKDAIAKIFLDPNSLQTTDIIKKIKEYSGDKEDFLLFENYANPNFLRLQHSLGAGGNAPQTLEIELVDPNNEFEKRVMMSTSYPDCVPFELVDSSGTPVSISDSQKLESKVRKDLYSASIIKYVNANTERLYYIAYGIGTNPRYWAGPFAFTLTNASIETTEFKKVSCVFTQIPNGLSEEANKVFNKKAKDATSSFGLKRQITGISKPLLFSEYIEGKSKVLYDPYSLATKESESIAQIKSGLGEKLSTRQGQKISLVSSFIKLIDFHSLVTDCIASYVAKATGNDNVIVLLPNLNSILATSEGFADLLSSPQASTKGIFLDKKLDIAFRIRLALSDALSYLNQMSFVMYPSESSDLKQDFSKLKTTDAKEVSWVTNTEKNQDKDARLKAFFKENSFYSVIDTVAQDNNTIDHYAVLLKFIDELNRLSNTLQMNLALYFESDVKILNVLKEYYDKGDPALRFPSSFQDVVVIVGDRDMIKKYLYAQEPIQNNKNDLLDTKVQITIQGKNDSTGKPTAVTNAIQLYHPKDKLFFTKDYNTKISDVIYPDDENPPFGSNQSPPDIFAYKKTDDFAAQGKLLNRYTIFRYNTANPNVLKLKTDINLAYLTELKTGFQKELFKSATTKLAGIYSDNYTLNAFLSEEAIIGYIQNKLRSSESADKDLILKQVSESLTANGIPSGLQGDPKTIAANCLALAEGGMVSKNRQTLIIDAFSPKNPALIMSDMSNTLYKKTFKVVLETLPMFNISNYSYLQSNCMLFAQSGKLMISDPVYETDPFAVFLSGLYILIGMKHVIEEGRVYSEFTLVRNQKSIVTNEFNKGKTV
jgi:hypothetical protein